MITGTTLTGVVAAGIIFDLDGVLMHSTPCHDRAYREILEAFPIRNFNYSDIAGMRTDQALRKTFADRNLALSEPELGALAARKTARVQQLIIDANPVAPDCLRTLSRLARHHRLALASSASQQTVETFLQLSGARDLFDSVLWGSMAENAKPAPDLYLRAAAELELQPQETLVVEDAFAGIEAGLAAGCAVCGITTMHSAEELRAAGASMTIVRLEELLKI